MSKGVTPWDDYIEHLDIGAKLDKQEKFVEIINRMIKMDQADIDKMLKFNNAYIKEKTSSERNLTLYRKMLKI